MKLQLFETCTTYLVQNVIPNSIKIPLFEIKIMEMRFLRRVRGLWSKMASQIPWNFHFLGSDSWKCKFLRRVRGIWSKMASPNPQKGAWIHFFGPGRTKTSPAGPPGQPGRQCRPVGLAGRRASLAAHGPAGCDLQVLQLAVDSGRGGEGGGRADNSPPLLSPQWVIWYKRI